MLLRGSILNGTIFRLVAYGNQVKGEDMKYLIPLIVIIILGCNKTVVEENYYSDITPFEMAGRAFWSLQYVDDRPQARVLLSAVITQIESGRYSNIWVHGRLKDGISLATISEDSSRLYNDGVYIEEFSALGQRGEADFAIYTQEGYANRPISPQWAMWVTYTTQEGIRKVLRYEE